MKTVTSKQLAWSDFLELPAASPGIHSLPHGVCLGSAHTRACPISINQDNHSDSSQPNFLNQLTTIERNGCKP
jgi:hypothetical protein